MLDEGGLAQKKQVTEFYSHHNPEEVTAEPESRLVAARSSKKRVGTEKTVHGYKVVPGFWSAENTRNLDCSNGCTIHKCKPLNCKCMIFTVQGVYLRKVFLSHTSHVVSGHLHRQADTQKAHITSPVRQNCSRTWRIKSEQAGKKI